MAEDRDRRNPDDRGYRPHHPRSGKDRRRWCKGRPGVAHEPHIVFRPWRDSTCRPAPPWSRRFGSWWCEHREECQQCGRVLRRTLRTDECPTYATTPPMEDHP